MKIRLLIACLAATAVLAAEQPTSPPMGWNSWDCFATTVTEAQTKAQADVMAEKLARYGWQYIVVDHQWYDPEAKGFKYRTGVPFTMDEWGRWNPATNRFPSGLKALADYVHSKGLKFGLHLMRGIPRQAVKQNTPIKGTSYRAADIANTNSICSWCVDMYGVDMSKPGAQEYYDSVFQRFSDWGLDFVKVDDISRPYDAVQKAEIEAIRRAIDKTGRPMVLSLSPGATPLAQGDHVRQYANMWRISDDFWDKWPELLAQFKRLRDWTPYRGPGHFPDADMLPLGVVDMGKRTTRFTRDEQITLMTLWCIARSPLILGCDLTKLDDFTLSLVTNEEVLAVNQDSTGNHELFNRDGLIGWIADVPDSTDKYLAVFNTREMSAPVPVPLSGRVRDLWQRKDIGNFKGEFAPEIASHGAGLYRISATVQPQPDGLTMGTLRLQVWSDRVIRVTDGPSAQSLSVNGQPGETSWKLKETPDEVVVETKALRVRLQRKTGAVEFRDRQDKLVLHELERGEFALAPDERIYGLGQHQAGKWDYRGTTVHLQQKNMEVALPVLVSSKGYGVLWDNPAVTDVVVGPKEVEWKSEVGNVDYYFMYGPQPDDVIRAYRELTGAAPLLPKWAWGFWQCKERYATQKEMIDVVAEYRKRSVPLDGIIQDWQYWKPGAWGSHEFDPDRYPDPAGMVKALHDMNVHVLVSVWPRFDSGTAHLKEFEEASAAYPTVFANVYPKGEGKWYDAFKPEGRRIYWKQLSETLFKLGFDGWWLDASEAELGGKWGEMRNFNAALYNAYPLMHSTGVYQGQRAETSAKRVCILTRSAYPGQQRNAAITWSGDIQGSWDAFAKQIPSGLNFSISGIPYWNTDIGGFFGKNAKDKKYQELFMRWFQYGTFCPMFRVHGTGGGKELWQWDEPTQKILEDYIRLRYRLLPYIYSVSWQVTSDGGTMMRPLMMDFPDALDVGDQFMFGPAVLVQPVTRAMYSLPPGTIPGEVFRTPDGKPGLAVQYFEGRNLEKPAGNTIEAKVDHTWPAEVEPPGGLKDHDNFSARWEAAMTMPEDGEYEIGAEADDGVRVWLDGELVADDWTTHPMRYNGKNLAFRKGQKVTLKIEYFQGGSERGLRMAWITPSQRANAKMDNRVETYLPGGADWYDFWTNERHDGGQKVPKPCPLDILPLYIRAGSIVPLGPVVQYAGEKPADPIELRVYPGADGAFTLYEDEGDNYNYEKGQYATIPFTWNNATGTLTIGAREKTYPGMLEDRTFRVVFIGGNESTVEYHGKAVVVRARK